MSEITYIKPGIYTLEPSIGSGMNRKYTGYVLTHVNPNEENEILSHPATCQRELFISFDVQHLNNANDTTITYCVYCSGCHKFCEKGEFLLNMRSDDMNLINDCVDSLKRYSQYQIKQSTNMTPTQTIKRIIFDIVVIKHEIECASSDDYNPKILYSNYS